MRKEAADKKAEADALQAKIDTAMAKIAHLKAKWADKL